MKISALHHFSSAVLLLAFCGSCMALAAQPPAAAPPSTTMAQPLRTPSAVMQPALDTLQQALGTLRTDRWKASGTVREGAAANISSIRRDLTTTLPSLLTAADAAPNSVTQMLPAFRNIEALYDVLLRVVETGRSAAPSQQIAALDDARARLEDARRTLGDRLQSAAMAQEQQVRRLQATIRAIPPPPVPVACPPPPPVKRHRIRKRVVKKAAPTSAKPQTSTPPQQH